MLSIIIFKCLFLCNNKSKMRKFYLLFLLAICSNIVAQTYHFDIMTNYRYESKNYKRDALNFANSQTNDYVIIVYKKNKNLTAVIYDYKNQKMHSFEAFEKNSLNENKFSFVYKNSEKYPRGMADNNDLYTVKIQKTNKDSILQIIMHDKNNIKKKFKDDIFLTIKKNPNNLFPLFQCGCLHPFELKKIDVPFNFLVLSSISSNESNCKLLDIQSMDLTLTVPE